MTAKANMSITNFIEFKKIDLSSLFSQMNSNPVNQISNTNPNNSQSIKSKNLLSPQGKDLSQNLSEQESKIKEPNESKDDPSITLVYPLSGKIINEKEYKFLTGFNKPNTVLPKKKTSMQNKNQHPRKVSMAAPKTTKYDKMSIEELDEEISKLNKQIEDSENDETYKKKIYSLEEDCDKWKGYLQTSICEFIKVCPKDENKNNMTIKAVLEKFGIEKSLVNYDTENDCFTY